MEKLFLRIKIALQSIGLNGIAVADNDIKYDYSEQGNILEDILEKKESLSKRERMVERANQIAKEHKMEEIKISKSSLSSEEEFQKALTKYSIQVRSKLKLFDLDNYCIFIASRYLDSIDDHKNLSMVCKRLRYNTNKFHYNPVSVDEETVKLFPNTETLNTYDNSDKYLTGGKIIPPNKDCIAIHWIEWNCCCR